uniref:BZIP domain-containing protein n=1 Tax=Strongyloides papillosus TaxID=174720 RepID=A0A0N5BYT9_STREA
TVQITEEELKMKAEATKKRRKEYRDRNRDKINRRKSEYNAKLRRLRQQNKIATQPTEEELAAKANAKAQRIKEKKRI